MSTNLGASQIEHGQGFVEWEKQELLWLDRLELDGKEKVLSRIKTLKTWAIENNMMIPKTKITE